MLALFLPSTLMGAILLWLVTRKNPRGLRRLLLSLGAVIPSVVVPYLLYLAMGALFYSDFKTSPGQALSGLLALACPVFRAYPYINPLAILIVWLPQGLMLAYANGSQRPLFGLLLPLGLGAFLLGAVVFLLLPPLQGGFAG